MFLFLRLLILAILLWSCRNDTENAVPIIGDTYIKTIGGNLDDVGRKIVASSDGQYAIAGWSIINNDSLRDTWFLKIDEQGNETQNRAYGDVSNDIATFILEASDNSLLITGSKGGGASQIYLQKTDPNGNELWDNNYGGSRQLISDGALPELIGVIYGKSGQSIIELSDGGFMLLAQYKVDNVNNNNGTITWIDGKSRVYLVRTDVNGAQLWAQEFDKAVTAYTMIEASDGSIFIAGEIVDGGIDNSNPVSVDHSSAYVMKVDLNGAIIWENTYNFSEWDIIRSIKEHNATIYMAGQTGSHQSGFQNGMLMAIDLNGTQIWQSTYGGASTDRFNDLIISSDEHLVAAGVNHSSDVGSGDAWILKSNLDGSLVWSRTYGEESVDIGFSLVEAADLGFIIIGETESFGAVSSDLLLLKTDPNGRIAQ